MVFSEWIASKFEFAHISCYQIRAQLALPPNIKAFKTTAMQDILDKDGKSMQVGPALLVLSPCNHRTWDSLGKGEEPRSVEGQPKDSAVNYWPASIHKLALLCCLPEAPSAGTS